jgi:transcriptional regulator with GAF, ATPase, and Fis domain
MPKRSLVNDDTTVLRSPVPESRSITTYALSILEGPDRGRRFELDGTASRALVGKGPACDVKLSDPEVSRRHAVFDNGERPLRLTDLGSTNGTFVNGVKVLDAHLLGGENVRVGQSTIHVELVDRARAVPLTDAIRFGRTLGASAEMRRLYPLCERLAATQVPIIIEGETGTGKEVLAESLHEMGPRAKGPFMVFDCTSVPANLLESELFGHERGAFTGAVATRKGIFEQADGGTLLVDEIGDLDLALQPKLLRAMQRGEVRRVGSDRTIAVDVRIIAATRRDLDKEVHAGRFRDDLFFRLAVGRIELPPLRRRHGDVALLAAAFWKEFGGEGELPYALQSRWELYEWPGNVRELRNEVARRAALGDLADVDRSGRDTEREPGGGIDPATRELRLPDSLIDQPYARAKERVLAEFERRYVERIVDKHGGNVSKAALASGLALRYFQLLRARHQRSE